MPRTYGVGSRHGPYRIGQHNSAPNVHHFVTIPSRIATELYDRGVRLECEITDEGLLYRPVKNLEPEDTTSPPSFLKEMLDG